MHSVLQTVILLLYFVQPVREIITRHKQKQNEEDPRPPPSPHGLGLPVPGHNFLHHFQLHVRQLAALSGGRLRGVLYPQQPAHRHAEPAAEGHQLVDFRQGGIGFPFINGLPGNAQLRAQRLL